MTRPAMRPALPTELQGTNLQIWCRLWDSNSRPTDYKSVALPTELRRHSDFLKTVFTHSRFIQSKSTLCFSSQVDTPEMYPKWLRGQDLNLRSPAYEAGELPGFSTPRQISDCHSLDSSYPSKQVNNLDWLRQQDSNLRPSD